MKADFFKIKSSKPTEPAKPTLAIKQEIVVATDVPTYRQSSVGTYLRCGLQYYWRYVEGLIAPPSAAQTVGTSTHAAIARNFITKKENGIGTTLEEALDVYSTDFEIRAQDTEWGDDDKGTQKDIGARCVTAHHTEIAPGIQPETVEESFVIETDAGFNLSGTLDLIDTSGVIHDAKTSKGKYEENAVSGALQPAIYDYAYEALRGKKAKGFQYDVMVKPTKTIGVRTQTIRSEVSEHDRQWALRTVDRVHRAIQAGVFLPAPEDSWVCSPKWCGYWKMCKGKK